MALGVLDAKDINAYAAYLSDDVGLVMNNADAVEDGTQSSPATFRWTLTRSPTARPATAPPDARCCS